MPVFAYSAIDRSGNLTYGEVLAASEAEALKDLQARMLRPVTIAEGKADIPWYARDLSFGGARKQLSLKVQAEFFDALSTMLSAKVPLIKAIEFQRDRASGASYRSVTRSIAMGVSAGDTLAETLRSSDAFEDRFVRLIDVGERANRLEMVVSALSGSLKAELQRQRTMRQALVYPMILLAMSLAVLGMLVFFLAPTLVPVFTAANVPAPTILAGLHWMGDFLLTHFETVSVVFLAVTGFLFLARAPLKAFGKQLAEHVPLLGQLIRAQRSQTFCQNVSLLLESGDDLVAALSVTEELYSNEPWYEPLQTVRQKVTAGSTLTEALAAEKLLDPDKLKDMLKQAAVTLNDRNSDLLNQLLRLLTPALTLTIGLSVAFLIFSTISAILDLNDLAS